MEIMDIIEFWIIGHIVGGFVSFILSMYIMLKSERQDMVFIRNILSNDPISLLHTIFMNMVYGQMVSWYDVSVKIDGIRSGVLDKVEEEEVE